MTKLMFIWICRPEVKENKEGADTEKAAEQSAEPEELVKEKVRKFVLTCWNHCN